MIIKPIIPLGIMIIIVGILWILVLSNKKRIFTRTIILVLLFLINIRFMLPNGKVEKISNNLNILFVIDNSISMIAEDYQGGNTRLKGLQEDCKTILSKLSGSNYALITFNNTSNIVMPFINDGDMIRNAIESIKAKNSLYAKGRSLNVSIEDMEFVLNNEDTIKEDNQVIVFFISDGEITGEDKSIGDFEKLKKYIHNGAVLGYGSITGGKMKADKNYYYKDSNGYMLDKTSSSYPKPLALSKIDEGNLNTIANKLGIDYIHMMNTSSIEHKLKEISAKTVKSDPTEEETYRDIYYVFAIMLLIVLGYEFIYIRRRVL